MSDDNDAIAILTDLKKSVNNLQSEIKEQGRRIAALETIAAPAQKFLKQETGLKAFTPPPPPDKKAYKKEARQGVSMEENIAGNWFAKIGITALVIGVAFFLKYAFDNDWIGETGRVLLGIVTGIVLLGVGGSLMRAYFLYAQIIFGGGLAILYLSVFAAFGFYDLIGYVSAWSVMAVITAAGIAASLRYKALSLIGVAIIGGFATPFLLWGNNTNHQASMFAFVLLLDMAVLVVSMFQKWRALNLISFIGTVTVFISWYLPFYSPDNFLVTMLWLTSFFVVYSFSTVAHNLLQSEPSTGSEQLLTLLAAAAYFGQSYIMFTPAYESIIGFFSLALAVYYFIFAFGTRHIIPKDDSLYNFLAALSVGFITLAIPLQFDQQIITAGWSVELVLLILLAIKVRKDALYVLSVAVAVLVAVRVLFFETALPLDDPLLIFNKRFFVFAFSAAAFYVGSVLCARARSAVSENDRRALWTKFLAGLLLAANIFTLVAGSQEIIDYYNHKQNVAYRQIQEIQSVDYDAAWQSPQRQVAMEKVNALRSQSSIALSLFWLLYAIVVIAIGFVGHHKMVRLGGISLLLIAVLKLFFYDLWSLGTLYRIISALSLGVVLLAISFSYQKYKHMLKKLI